MAKKTADVRKVLRQSLRNHDYDAAAIVILCSSLCYLEQLAQQAETEPSIEQRFTALSHLATGRATKG